MTNYEFSPADLLSKSKPPVVLLCKTGHGGFARGLKRITNYRFIIPFLMLFLVMAFGCQKVDKPVRGEEGSSPMAIVTGDPEDAPLSHSKGTTSGDKSLKTDMFTSSSLEGLDYWKAYHPTLITGTHNPALKADTDEACLDCHDQSTSCNNCHTYVGVNLVTAAEE